MKHTALAAAAISLAIITPAKAEPSTGLKLAAAAFFVQENCPGLKPNLELFGVAIRALGEDPEDYSNRRSATQAFLIAQGYARTKSKSCREAWDLFGDNGTAMPGLVERD